MKLIETDRNIIKSLNDEKCGLSEKQILAILGIEKKNRTIINKRLNKLFKNGVIDRINAYPNIYYINAITDIKVMFSGEIIIPAPVNNAKTIDIIVVDLVKIRFSIKII